MLQVMETAILLLISITSLILCTNDTEWWIVRKNKKRGITFSSRGRVLLALLIGVVLPIFAVGVSFHVLAFFVPPND